MDYAMQGVYVNAQAQMTLVANSDVRNETFLVLTSEDEENIVTITAKGMVTMGNVQGLYNGADTIQWNNGDTWRRVQMSSHQFRMLTHRPYVPLTFVAFAVLKSVMHHAFTAVSMLRGGR